MERDPQLNQLRTGNTPAPSHRLAGRKDSIVVGLEHDDFGGRPPRDARGSVELKGGRLEVLGRIAINGKEGMKFTPDLLSGRFVAGSSEENPPQALVVAIGQLALAG